MITLIQNDDLQTPLMDSLRDAVRRRIPSVQAGLLDLRNTPSLALFQYLLREKSKTVEPSVIVYAPQLGEDRALALGEEKRFEAVSNLARQLGATYMVLTARAITANAEPLPYPFSPEGGAILVEGGQLEHYLIGSVHPTAYPTLGKALVDLLDSGVFGRYNWSGRQMQGVSKRLVEGRIPVLDRQ